MNIGDMIKALYDNATLDLSNMTFTELTSYSSNTGTPEGISASKQYTTTEDCLILINLISYGYTGASTSISYSDNSLVEKIIYNNESDAVTTGCGRQSFKITLIKVKANCTITISGTSNNSAFINGKMSKLER